MTITIFANLQMRHWSWQIVWRRLWGNKQWGGSYIVRGSRLIADLQAQDCLYIQTMMKLSWNQLAESLQSPHTLGGSYNESRYRHSHHLFFHNVSGFQRLTFWAQFHKPVRQKVLLKKIQTCAVHCHYSCSFCLLSLATV